jgi:hypothetical protein
MIETKSWTPVLEEGTVRRMKGVNSGVRAAPAPDPGVKAGPCERCSKVEPLFMVDGKRLCVGCFEMNLAVEPRRPRLERRQPGNEARGFGRRFQDGVNSNWSSEIPPGSNRPR